MNENGGTADLAFLKRGSWFGGLPPTLQQRIVDRSTIREFRKRSHLVREGAATRGLFVVLEGRVHVLRTLPDASEALVHVGEAGFWFGEYALLSGEKAIASVVAVTDVRVMLLPSDEFDRLVRDDPHCYPCFARLLYERFDNVFRFASEARTVAAEEWLRRRLHDMALSHRLADPGHGPVDIRVSQSELASLVGVSRQTLCMLLRRMEERGQVEVAYKKIRVLPTLPELARRA
jgi:CRP-like cAMP-binding protein